jgi:heme/copper-type cytochrome/quinol oxidase subunit 1
LAEANVYTLVRRFIKTGIAFLFAGLAMGGWMQVQRDLLGVWPNPYLRSAHIHAVLVGFVMFLILGVALWLFPRPAKDDRRYRPGRIEAAYWILLTATVLRVVGEAAQAWTTAPALRYAALTGGLGQIAGLGVYFWSMWGRIRPVGSRVREEKGERF